MGLISLIAPFAIISILILIHDGKAYQVGNNPFRRAEVLDPEGKYLLEWEVDWISERIIFNVTVETRGWVGLGLSNDETSSGADMVIGGVEKNGQVYFSDRHTVGGSDIFVLDKKQDWTLHSGWESRTHTFLCFSRALDTCDAEDYQITLNQISLLWAYGRNDNEDGGSPQNSGTFGIYLLDPDYAPQVVRDRSNGSPKLISNGNENIPSDAQPWSVQISRTIPTNDTSYICGIHKAPRLRRKHHFIGYDIHFPNEESRLRAHHLDVYRCHAPAGSSAREMFEQHLSNPGEACYLFRTNPGILPTDLCTELYIVWTVGGRAFFMPEHVGVVFGATEDEYYLTQLHYDNPERQSGIQVDVRLDFFYTSQLRPNEGGVMSVNGAVPGLPESFTIPGNSRDHRIVGHCSSECTQRMYPPRGIKLLAVTLHGHNAASGMRLRHFRGKKELPWISYDDNYDNQLQPLRHLRSEVRVLPGDQLTVDCLFTNNDTTTVGGYSTRQEMCMAFLVHYDRVQDYSSCTSEINSEAARYEFLGIRNVTWVTSELAWIVDTPTHLAGFKVSEVSDNFVNWTPKRRRELQRFHEVHPHSGGCHKDNYAREVIPPTSATSVILSSLVLNTPDDYRGPVSYPFRATPHSPPPRACPSRIG